MRVVGIAAGLSIVVGVILLAFAWPSITASAKDLPVGIVGTAAQVSPVQDAIEEQSDGAIELIRYDDREAAVAAIDQRKAYGAIVLGAEATDAPDVLKATAASAQVVTLMDGLGRQLQSQIDTQIRTQIEQTLTQAQEGMAAAVQAAVQAALSGQTPTAPSEQGCSASRTSPMPTSAAPGSPWRSGPWSACCSPRSTCPRVVRAGSRQRRSLAWLCQLDLAQR